MKRQLIVGVLAMLVAGLAFAVEPYATAGAGHVRTQNNLDGTLYHAGGGLQLSPNFAVEALFHQMEDVTEDAPKGYSVSAIAQTGVGGFSPYVRAGFFANDHGDDSWLAGAGVKWNILAVEYQHIHEFTVGNAAVPVNAVNVSATFRF